MKGSLFVASCILPSVTEDKEFTMAAMVGSKFVSVSACLGGLYHRLMRELCMDSKELRSGCCSDKASTLSS